MASFTLLHVIFFLLAFVEAAQHHGHRHIRHKRQSNSTVPFPTNSTGACYYWMESIKHQGLAPLAGAGYQVFRNVKDYGAVGDGVADDTAAINRAISEGNRCAPGSCNSTTTTPAVVYFPPGTYSISAPIVDYYYTQLIGNPNCLPVVKATSSFVGIALIDGDPYGPGGTLTFGATNVFWRQIRNFILDQTDIPIDSAIFGVHWPTGQATSLQNVAFQMSAAPGTKHQGLFIENGSGGFLTDLSFYGGDIAANLGNQQFTMRNLSFYNAVTAINQLYNWGWTYTGISINNCQLGFNLSNGGPNAQSVGSVTLFDSEINNTPVGVLSAFTDKNSRFTNGSLILENVALNNVPVAVQGPAGPYLVGSTGQTTIAAWGQGHAYSAQGGPTGFQGAITPNTRPAGLIDGNQFYQRSKPQYETFPASQFLSARDAGARGDGVSDDTQALQGAINSALQQGKFLFIDAGSYKVSSTIYIPGGSIIVGEAYPVILGSGAFFSDVNAPKPVVQIGKAGERGSIEWSDTIVSTQGATAGAILFEYNLASSGPGYAQHSKRDGWGQWSSSAIATATATTTSTYASSAVGSTPSAPSDDDCEEESGNRNDGPANYGQGSSGGTGAGGGSKLYPHPTPSNGGAWSPWNTWNGSPPGGSKPYPTGTGTPQPGPYTPTGPAGLWDVHARVGGFAGSELTYAECPTTATVFSPPGPIDRNCIAAFLTFHITSSAANAYLENVWIWVADHDIEDQNLRQITIYAGRGLLVESTEPIWLWGTAVEHHTLYEYQFVKASTVYMGQIQTETAYYQPNPPVLFPFDPNPTYSDPDFRNICYETTGFNFTSQPDFTNDCDGYGLRIVNSHDILTYGAGLYSFFDNYNTSCSAVPPTPDGPYGCQSFIFSLEGSNSGISVYNLNTVGSQSMIDIDGKSIANYKDNQNVFPNSLALFRL